MSEKLLLAHEVAERLRTTESTLAYWRQQGVGPAWARVGRRCLYREGDVEQWISGRFDATADQAQPEPAA